MYIPIPHMCAELSSFDFVQDPKRRMDLYQEENNLLGKNFWGKEQISHSFASFGLSWNEETIKELLDVSRQVSCVFCRKLHSRSMTKLFNGLMYGVLSFETPSNPDESQKAVLQFYKTDYFTFRVISSYYEVHKKDIEVYLRGKTFPNINSLSIPFLSSFGVSMIAIISNYPIGAPLNDTDLVVIVRRSQNVPDNPGKWHFTMNEAFVPGDVDNYDNNYRLSFTKCASRGFEEETDWRKDLNRIKFSQYRFTTVLYDREKSQMGITGLVKISIRGFENMAKAKDHLTLLYNNARDKVLESDNLQFVPIGELNRFIDKEGQLMSAPFAYALKVFSSKYRDLSFSE